MFRKKLVKRVASCLMAFAIVVSGFPGGTFIGKAATAYAADTSEEKEYTVGNSIYKYKELEDGTIEISGYEGKDTEVVIPEEIDGKKVTSIGERAFAENDWIENVELSNSITKIESGAFDHCEYLSKIKLSNSLLSIKNWAFRHCQNLNEIEIPNCVTDIGRYAFDDIDSFVIYGAKGSYAEKFADYFYRGYISFVELCEIKSSDKIDIIYKNIYKTEKLAINTKCLSNADAEYKNIKKNLDDDVKFVAYNISLLDENGNMLQPIKNSTVKIPLPIEYDKDKCKIYCYRKNGTIIDVNAIYQDGYMVFETDQFGTYLLTEAQLNAGIEQNEYTIGDSTYKYRELEDKTLEISGYEGIDFDIEIPEKIDGKKVTSIGKYAFSYAMRLRYIDMPSSITNIDEYAFANCTNLMGIKLSNGLLRIGIGAFQNCRLSEIDIPIGVSYIGEYAFSFDYEYCTMISVVIPETVTYIGKNILDDGGIREKTIYGIKDSVAYKYATDNNIMFEEIKLIDNKNEDDVHIIYRQYKYELMSKIKKYKETDTVYKSIATNISVLGTDFEAYEINMYYTDDGYAARTSATVKIPCSEKYDKEKCNVYLYEEGDGMTDMQAVYINGYMVFHTDQFGTFVLTEASNEEVTINKKILVDDVTGIKVILPHDYRTDVSLKVEQLTESPEGRNIILKDTVAEYIIYDIALVDSNGEKISLDEEVKVKIPEPDWEVEGSCDYTVEFGRLDENEWGDYKDISTEFEEGYELFNTNEWGIYAFRLYTSENSTYKYNYRYKILDDGCIEIVSGSYYSEKLIIPETINGRRVTSIGAYAFSHCDNLESIDIPDSVVSIGESAFAFCHNLQNIRLSNNLTKIERQTFWYSGSNVNANGIEIPDGVVSIEEGAFGYSGFEYIKIPKSVTTMDTSFEFCQGLKRIDVDEENTQYSSKDGVLFDKKMETLIRYPIRSEYVNYHVPEGTVYIASGAFETSRIESIEIPDTVKKMGTSVFWECRRLKDVKLPDSIDTIEAQTFCVCTSLQNVNIPNTVTKINGQAFRCENLTKLEIPSSVKTIHESAIIENDNLTIYGEKGSAIEAYAKENNIPFVISSKLYDSSTGIEVEFQDGDKKDGVSLKTKLLTESDEQYKNIILTDNIVDTSIKPEDVKLNAYDITLVDENNNQVQPTKSVTVRIHCPDGYNGAKCKVYRVEGKGKYTDMNATYQNGYMVFDTDHFSTYIVTETELKQKADILYGDANGDGQINTQDAVLIKKYLAEYDNVDIDLEASDVNGDGTVTSADAVLLLKYLAEYDVTLGE